MKRNAAEREVRSASWQWALAPVALALLIYANSLSNGFVFDDIPLILDNQQIRSLRHMAEIFGRQGYRPVRTLTYALDYWLFGFEPFYFHLTNVLFHAANGVLFFLLLRRLFQKPAVALAGALLFVSHPVQTAAVAYVSGRKDLLAGGLVLAGLLCFARARDCRKKITLAVSLALFALAAFSKEVAVVFPALMYAWDCMQDPGGSRRAGQDGVWRRAVRVLAEHRYLYGSLLVAAAAFLYYAQFIMYASRKSGNWGGSALHNYLTSFKLFGHYLRLAVVPYPLIADYNGVFPVVQDAADAWAWVGAALALGYLGLVYAASRRRPLAAFGLFWFLVTLLPVIQLLPFHEIAADHYLYLPLAGLLIALLDVAREALERLPALPRAVPAAAVTCLMVVFALVTVDRNRDWHDTRSLWEATVLKAPGSARVQNNLGTTLHAAGDLDEALKHLERATALDPEVAAYWSNLGTVLHDRGNYEAAVKALERATALEPANSYSQTNLGNAVKKLALSRDDRNADSALWREAIAHLKRAVELNSANGALRYNLGSAYYELEKRKEARQSFEEACRTDPGFGRAYYALGLMDSEDGDLAAAAERLERSIVLDPQHLESIQLLSSVRQKQGEYSLARTLLEAAVGRFPSSSDLRWRLALIYKALDEAAKAREQLNLALQLEPAGQKADEIRQLLDSL